MNIHERARRVVGAQLVLAAVLGIVAFLVYGSLHGLSAVYGVLVGVMLTLLLNRSVTRAEQVAQTDPKGGMTVLYVGAVQRFFLFIAAFAVGLAGFGLDALATAVGFVAAQFAQLVNARGMTRNNEEEGLK